MSSMVANFRQRASARSPVESPAHRRQLQKSPAARTVPDSRFRHIARRHRQRPDGRIDDAVAPRPPVRICRAGESSASRERSFARSRSSVCSNLRASASTTCFAGHAHRSCEHAESRYLASIVDGVALVIESGKTRKAQALSAKRKDRERRRQGHRRRAQSRRQSSYPPGSTTACNAFAPDRRRFEHNPCVLPPGATGRPCHCERGAAIS